MIGKRLKTLRLQLNMTQKKFGELIGVKHAIYNHYENDIRNPSLKVISSIAKSTNCNTNWLLTGEGPMFLNQKPNTNNVPAREETSKLKKLEGEIAALKKSISELEKECQELDIQNKELNNKLVHRMQELLDAKDKLLELSKA